MYGGGIGTKMPLNHISFHTCHWIKHRSIQQYFSCHWIVCHSIGPYFSCHWIGLHAIGSGFMPLDQTSCHWIMHHSNGRCGCCPLRQLIGIYVIGLEFMSLDHTYIILSDHNTLCATISLFHLILHYLSAQIPMSASAL